MAKAELNGKGGIFRKDDIILVNRTDMPGGVGFKVEMDSISGFAGQHRDEEFVLVRAGGVAGTRIDSLHFTSAKRLHKNGRSKVVQIMNCLEEGKWSESEPIPVVVKKIK